MTADDTVRVLSPVPRDLWQRALDADPDALVTQTPGWLDAMCAAGPYRDAGRYYEWGNGRRLVLPMVRRRLTTAARGDELAWPLDWGIGGVVAPGGPVTDREAAAVYADLTRRPGSTAYLRPNPLVDEVWRRTAPAGARPYPRITQILDLSGGRDVVWRDRFSGSARSAVRRAEKFGLTVERGTGDRLIGDFDHLYRLSVDRWARQENTPLWRARRRARRKDPRRKFAAVVRNLADCQVWVAYRDGVPVAGTITMRHGRHAKYWRGAMDKPLAGPTGASTWLLFLAIEEACALGCRYFHMGDSRPDTPVTRFKQRLGARVHHTAGYWLTGAAHGATARP
ncbi:GNAT family N-acetyltransferase, partial [Streptomyces sparsus]